MRKSVITGIKLLVEERGRKVWKTFRGAWLVGFAVSDKLFLGPVAKDHKRWGHDEWFALQSEKGKLVVYRRDPLSDVGTITVFDTMEDMRTKIPEEVFEDAAEAAGLRPPLTYPEEPLDV